jgi:hypothetical protein
MIRGHFVGDGTDPSPMDEEYPYLEWNSSVKMWSREGDQFKSAFQDRFTVRCAPSYTFSGTALEVRGRAEPGSPLRLDASIEVENTAPSPPSTADLSLMERARIFADGMTGHGRSIEVPPFLGTVFGLAAVQMSLFEAIEVLLLDNRLPSAVLLLQSLVEGACRLQAVAENENPTGVAVRIRLDSLDRQAALYAKDEDVAQRIQNTAVEYRSAAESRGITIPDSGPNITETQLYAESRDTLDFAREVARGEDTAIALHTVADAQGTHALQTRVPDQRMALGIAADAASTLLTSAVSLATIMGWSFDSDAVANLKAEVERIGAEDSPGRAG